MVDRNLCTNVNQRIELWSSIYPRLLVGCASLLMSDFNICVDASQSASWFSLMNSYEQAVWTDWHQMF